MTYLGHDIRIREPRCRIREQPTPPFKQACAHHKRCCLPSVAPILQVPTRERPLLEHSHQLVVISFSLLPPFRFGEPIDLSFGRSPIRPQSHLPTQPHSHSRTLGEEKGSSPYTYLTLLKPFICDSRLMTRDMIDAVACFWNVEGVMHVCGVRDGAHECEKTFQKASRSRSVTWIEASESSRCSVVAGSDDCRVWVMHSERLVTIDVSGTKACTNVYLKNAVAADGCLHI